VDRRDSVAPSFKGEPPEEGKLDIKPDIKSKVSDRTKLRNETIEKIVSDYLMKDPSFGSILKDLRATKGTKFGTMVNKIWKIVDAIASSKATYVLVMSRARPGLKAPAWAWLWRAWAYISSGPSPSPGGGLGLARLGLRPGLESRVGNFQQRFEHSSNWYEIWVIKGRVPG
jgi:hypothetical protein